MRRALQRTLRTLLLPRLRRMEAQRHHLRYLFFELTQACNLACRHCGSDCVQDSRAPVLSVEAVRRVLEDVARFHDPHQVMVVLTGGEPLCHPHLFEIGAAIHALEFPWGMVSNGYAWTPAAVEAARAAGMGSLTLSLDGFAPEHDWFRGREGSFERALASLQLFQKAAFLQAMDVVTCVHRRNLATLEPFRAFLGEQGVPAWRLFTISPIGRAAKDPDLLLEPAAFQAFMADIARFRHSPGPSTTYSESGFLGAHECRVRDEPCFCRAGINIAGVMCNGDLLACPNIDRRFAQGNILRQTFSQVWAHEYRIFRDRRWMRRGPCRTCAAWRLCEGNAFHLWEPDGDGPRLCHLHQFDLKR